MTIGAQDIHLKMSAMSQDAHLKFYVSKMPPVENDPCITPTRAIAIFSPIGLNRSVVGQRLFCLQL